MSPIVDDLLESWTGETQLSARSVLVTVLGDVIGPLQQPVWLSDLIVARRPARVLRSPRSHVGVPLGGRGLAQRGTCRSPLSLLAYAVRPHRDRVGERTHLRAGPPRSRLRRVAAGLRRRRRRHAARQPSLAGLRRDQPDGLGPTRHQDPPVVNDLAARLDHPTPTTALARFDNIEPLITEPSFQQSSGLADSQAAYRRFVERYAPAANGLNDPLSPDEAFVLRTMMIHDYRRVRLADPELPAPLLGESWAGIPPARWRRNCTASPPIGSGTSSRPSPACDPTPAIPFTPPVSPTRPAKPHR